jgi:hypothetical protein
MDKNGNFGELLVPTLSNPLAIVLGLVIITSAIIIASNKKKNVSIPRVDLKLKTLSETFKTIDNSKGKKSGEHNVYVLINKNREISYVGRTKSLENTITRHHINAYRSDLKLIPIIKNTSPDIARGMEQYLIEACGTLLPDKDYPTFNQINGMRKLNPRVNVIRWEMAQTYADENEIPCK